MFFIHKTDLIKDVLNKNMIVVDENLNVNECVELMLMHNLKEVFVVCENKKLRGIFTLSDVSEMKKNKADENIKVKECMKRNLITVKLDMQLSKCKDLMAENEIGRLPVVEGDSIVGVIREEEIRDYFYSGMVEVGKKLDHIINNIQEAVCVINEDARVIIWNRNAEMLYNVKSTEILGKKLSLFFPSAKLLEVLNTKKPYDNAYHSPRKDTEVIVSAYPIFIDGQLVGAVSIDKDISKIKKLADELEKANRKLELLQSEVKKYSDENFGNIIGSSENLIKKIDIARQVSKTNASIMILGESGTGKEVFSRAIHNHSSRDGLFVPVNCSAIPSELFESEFFGYESGAFTGANKKGKIGIFELANNGTVFLDEIADLPLHMQAKLLRVLQEGEIRRVGGEKSIKTDFRIISATNKNLNELIYKEKFREDLYYRLNVVEINLPSLRERKNDIVLMIHEFLKEMCRKNNKAIPIINNDVIEILVEYEWKGNVRELKNTIEHLVVLYNGNAITKDIIPSHILKKYEENIKNVEENFDLVKNLACSEVKLIKRALEVSCGNKAKTAKLLNIPRSTLYYKMDVYKM